MNQLKVGYSQIVANPPLDIAICGYFVPRFAKGFLDDIEVSTIILEQNGEKNAIISLDVCELEEDNYQKYVDLIEKATQIKKDNVFLSVTHTHTSAYIEPNDMFTMDGTAIKEYANYLGTKIVESVELALKDLKPSRVGYGSCVAPEKISYIRRYKMKDGSTMTCPPVNDENIDYPLGELDKIVNIVRFNRENADDVVIINYGIHADTVNGELISSDFVGPLRRTVEKALDGTRCIFIPGAQGDVGSTNVFPKDGDMNDTEISFDNEMKSPGMARFVGRALAGCILQVYDKVKFVDVDQVKSVIKDIVVDANVPTKEQMPLAKKYKEYHEQDRDDLIPYTAMELTTVVAEALRMCRLENGPETFNIRLSGLKIGPIALLGIAGEAFTEIGVNIKKAKGYEMIMPCSLVNGCMGYFPNKEAFDEGGYEARSSNFKGDVCQKIIDGGKALIESL